MIYKTIRKDVKVNGKRAHEDTILQEGDQLSLYIPEEKLNDLTRQQTHRRVKRQFRIAYEDENLLIVEKPSGLLTHGDSREKKNTLANQVCGYLQEKGEFDPSKEKSFVPSPVNRLDRNTTGLVIFGKNAETLRSFTRYIRERQYVSKYYVTLVKGNLKEKLVLRDRIAKDHGMNISQVTDDAKEGKSAETFVTPIASKNGFSVVNRAGDRQDASDPRASFPRRTSAGGRHQIWRSKSQWHGKEQAGDHDAAFACVSAEVQWSGRKFRISEWKNR